MEDQIDTQNSLQNRYLLQFLQLSHSLYDCLHITNERVLVACLKPMHSEHVSVKWAKSCFPMSWICQEEIELHKILTLLLVS